MLTILTHQFSTLREVFITFELSYCKACYGTFCNLYEALRKKTVAWTRAHTGHTQTHTGMSGCFFLDLNVGFYIPHSSLALCVLGDLPKSQCQPFFNCTMTSVLPLLLKDKTRTSTHLHTLIHTHLTRSTADQSIYVM